MRAIALTHLTRQEAVSVAIATSVYEALATAVLAAEEPALHVAHAGTDDHGRQALVWKQCLRFEKEKNRGGG